MKGKIKESLTLKIGVKLYKKNSIIGQGTREKAGLEWRQVEEELIKR